MEDLQLAAFPARLRELRSANKWTQEEMAEKLNLHRTTYTKYETGKANPDRECLMQLAQLFHVSVDYLLGQGDVPEESELEDGEAVLRLSAQEQELLSAFRRMPDSQRKRLLDQAQRSRTPRGTPREKKPRG